MFKYVLLGTIFVIEVFYVLARRQKERFRSKAQTRARWFAQLVFAHLALEEPSTLVLCGFFLWARAIHMFTFNKWLRNALWLCGLAGLVTPLLLHHGRDYYIYSTLVAMMGMSMIWSCFCSRDSHEFVHVMWGHLFFLLILLPSAIVADLLGVSVLDEYIVPLALFLLYLRMRTFGCLGGSKNTADPARLDYATIFEALENTHALRLYLSGVDEGIKDIFDTLDRDCTQVHLGKLTSPMKSAQYAGALEYLEIEYRENDLFGVRDDLIMYIHKHYDRRRFWAHVKSFFCPDCGRTKGFVPVACHSPSIVLEESSGDSLLDYSIASSDRSRDVSGASGASDVSDVSDASETEIVYAEIKDFNTPAILQDSS